MTTAHLPGTRLTLAGGISAVVVGLAHLAVTASPHWAGWLAGELRDRTASDASFAAFWANPGGLGLPLVTAGILLIRLARRGEAAPVLAGIVLTIWAAICVVLIGPASGFTIGLAVGLLVLLGGLRGRLAPRPVRAGSQ